MAASGARSANLAKVNAPPYYYKNEFGRVLLDAMNRVESGWASLLPELPHHRCQSGVQPPPGGHGR